MAGAAPPADCAGYLEKRARKSGRNWKKRWFDLQHPHLIYRESPGKKEKGRILLSRTTVVVKSSAGGDSRPHTFEIVVDPSDAGCERLTCAADSAEEYTRWHKFIGICIAKLKDKYLSTRDGQALHRRPGSLHNLPPPPALPGPPSALPGPPSALPGPPSALPGPPQGESKQSVLSSNDVGGGTKRRAHDAPVDDPKLWAWGSNLSGQCGQSQSSVQNTANPKHIEALKRKNSPKFADCGSRHSVAVTVSGDIFAFGEGGAGQMGTGDRVDRSSRPYLLKSMRKKGCVMLASYRDHNVCVLGNGDVYSWGDGAHGALGLGADTLQVKEPTLMPTLGKAAGFSIATVACGGTHSVFVTAAGALWVSGGNELGQLGLGHTDPVYAPTIVDSVGIGENAAVRSVACGESFTVLCTDGGQIMCAGFVGVPTAEDASDPDADEESQYAKAVAQPDFAAVPLPDDEVVQLSNSQVLVVAAGFYHAAALVGRGPGGGGEAVFTWGENVHGALGHGDEDRRSTPTRVAGLPPMVEGMELALGSEFSAVLTNDDRLYVWGKGDNGQLGNGYYVDALSPCLAQNPADDVHFVSICCGQDHMLGVTGKGEPLYDPEEDTMVRQDHAKATAIPAAQHVDANEHLMAVLGGLGKMSAAVEAVAPPPPPPPAAPEEEEEEEEAEEQKEEQEQEQEQEWMALVDPGTGRTYWANHKEKRTTWTDPHAKPAAGAATAAPAGEVSWVNKDANGDQHGPFESSKMKAWYQANMIHWNLQIKRSDDAHGEFKQLNEVFPDKATAFV